MGKRIGYVCMEEGKDLNANSFDLVLDSKSHDRLRKRNKNKDK